MILQNYINFNGNCREAVEFYAQVFGSTKPQFMLFEDMPPNENFPINEETKNLVMHANIKFNENTIMFSDALPGSPVIVGNNITLVINSGDIEEIKSVFNQLKADGTVLMELQETFWSKCYGYLIDRFGIGWQLSLDNGQIK